MARSTLDPETRLLYGESLQAPAGYRFDGGVATTFSMDFATALSVPVSLALFAAENRDEILNQPIALLEGAERVAGKLAIYVDAGQIQAEHGIGNRLCSLLEQVVVEVQAPGGGSFHPKLWALRYRPLDDQDPTLMRLLILSRNLTRDRSWDAILRLDGRRGGRPVAANRPLWDLVSALPDLAVGNIDERRRALTRELAEDLRHSVWDLPENCEDISFAVNGIGSSRWRPERSSRIAVVSPFCDGGALDHLAGFAKQAPVLIGRPDQLACVADETLDRFRRVMVLDELAETEDGEEVRAEEQQGLHAKIFIQETGRRSRLTLGSGNATSAALLTKSRGPTTNVEVFATLDGTIARLGGIDAILGEAGFGRLTREFVRGEIAAPSPAEVNADRVLLEARRRLARAGLRLQCEVLDDEDGRRWRITLVPPAAGLQVDGLSRARMWLITQGQGHARETIEPIRAGTGIELGEVVLMDVTRFVAVEITEKVTGRSETFSTSLPMDGMPEERDGAILKWVINGRDAFMRYLHLLLSELGDPIGPVLAAQDGAEPGRWRAGRDDQPLLENLVRAHCEADGRLDAVERLVARLEASGATGQQGVPLEFLELWDVFRAAMRDGSDEQ